MGELDARVLGELEIWFDGRLVDVGHGRQRQVLAALLLEPNRQLSSTRLVNLLWGAAPPAGALSTLYSYVSRLRTALGSDFIQTRPNGYLLRLSPSAIDLERFRTLVTRARVAGEHDEAIGLLDEALAFWRGEPFAGMNLPWLNVVRDRMQAERLAAECDRNDHRLRAGSQAGLVPELFALTERHPLDERIAGQLMTALYRDGRPGEALQQYRLIRNRSGGEPGRALRALHHQVLTSDSALDFRPEIISRSFLPPSPAGFTGRRRELAALDRIVAGRPKGELLVVAITGAEGAGKTWLALRWAHDNLTLFPDGLFFADVDDGDRSGASAGLLEALGVSPARIPADPQTRTGLYRSLLADKRVLLILDNAINTANIGDLLPGGPDCMVLVTSRLVLSGLMSAHDAVSLPLTSAGT